MSTDTQFSLKVLQCLSFSYRGLQHSWFCHNFLLQSQRTTTFLVLSQSFLLQSQRTTAFLILSQFLASVTEDYSILDSGTVSCFSHRTTTSLILAQFRASVTYRTTAFLVLSQSFLLQSHIGLQHSWFCQFRASVTEDYYISRNCYIIQIDKCISRDILQ